MVFVFIEKNITRQETKSQEIFVSRNSRQNHRSVPRFSLKKSALNNNHKSSIANRKLLGEVACLNPVEVQYKVNNDKAY